MVILLFHSVVAQTTCELFLMDNKLKGKCEKARIIAGFEIELKEAQLDSAGLFGQLPLAGKFVIHESAFDSRFTQVELDEFSQVEYVLTERAGFPQILMKTKLGWFTMDVLTFTDKSLSFEMDLQPTPPVTDVDLKIIRKTKELLGTENDWHKKDDRNCEDDIEHGRYSLFCALKTASIEFEGDYNHRNAIMQKVRVHINKRHPNKKFAHRLRDYNNMPETSYNDLINLLVQIENEVIEELN